MLVTGELTATRSVWPVAGSANAARPTQSAVRTLGLICGSPGWSGRAGYTGGRRTALHDGAMNILSIQSWVAYGHVGNASAVFPLQRLGAEVWSINTVQFSNHTGYGHWTGQVYSGDAVRELVDGIAARDVLRHCDAVLSGYMGDAQIGDAILHAVATVRRANRHALYC